MHRRHIRDGRNDWASCPGKFNGSWMTAQGATNRSLLSPYIKNFILMIIVNPAVKSQMKIACGGNIDHRGSQILVLIRDHELWPFPGEPPSVLFLKTTPPM